MSQGLKKCPTCGNPHPEIESGDIVRCECGEWAYFDRWQAGQAEWLVNEDDHVFIH